MTNYITLKEQVLLQFQLQGEEPNSHPTHSHPDPIIRNFFRAASKKFTQQDSLIFEKFIKEVALNRPDINDVHLVNLWFRATQHLFIKKSFQDYQKFSEDLWTSYFNYSFSEDMPKLIEIISKNNTATHVPQRYRSLAAAIRLLQKSNPTIELKIGDIGCSLGLGLKASLSHQYLTKPEFIDNTPGKLISSLFEHKLRNVSRAIGIDVKLPTVEWVKSCNYPSRYLADGSVIDQAIIDLSLTPFNVEIVESDILDPKTITVLNQLNIIYSSITLYELTPSQKQTAYKHIAQALSPDGLFIEFTFIDPKNWFKGVNTNIHLNQNGKLSPPLNWLIWNDTRCSQVGPGKDFVQVNNLLTLSK